MHRSLPNFADVRQRTRCRLCYALRRFLFEPLCGALLFNSDLSLELDRTRVELERLQEELTNLRGTHQ